LSLGQGAMRVISAVPFPAFRQKGTVVKPAALLGLILLVLPFASRADENLVAKREACRLDARMRIFPKGKIGVDGYQRIVELRNAHVTQCMAGALKPPPLPPKREIAKVKDPGPETRLPVKKKSRRIALRMQR
jgi:hypothetical protein